LPRAFGSLISESSTPAGRAAKAAFVGAKTVNGPAASRSSSRPATWRAVKRVLKSGVVAAMPVTVRSSGNITPSRTWMMPFEQMMSVLEIWTPSMVSAWASTTARWPLTVVRKGLPSTAVESRRPGTTW
jgi:hypothetical protein